MSTPLATSRYGGTAHAADAADQDALLAALADSVTIKPTSGSRSSSNSLAVPPPARPRRSHSDSPSSSSSHRGGASTLAPPPPTTRATSSGWLANKNPFSDLKKERKRDPEKAKKSSRHADAIDRLDPSSLWGTGMFHHESAYDAAAPSRNKATSKAAPMAAFEAGPSGSSGAGSSALSGASGTPKLSPLAQHTLKEMRDRDVKFDESTTTPMNDVDGQTVSYFPSDTTAAGAATGGNTNSATTPDGGIRGALTRSRSRSKLRERERDAQREAESVADDDYYNARAKVAKNALASAWGVADSEAYEDFGWAAPVRPNGETGLASATSSIWNGHEGRAKAIGGRGVNGGEEAGLENEAGVRPMGEDELVDALPTKGPIAAGGATGVKRTKSLMQRIKHMRNNPNVPVSDSDGLAPSSPLGSPREVGGSGTFSTGLPTPALPSPSAGVYSSSVPTGSHLHHQSRPSSSGGTNGRTAAFLRRQQGGAGEPLGSPTSERSFQDAPSSPVRHSSGDKVVGAAPVGSKDKSLPTLPDPAEDPFADAPPELSSRRGVRSPPPPPAPIPVPGATTGGYFPRVDSFEADNTGKSSGGSGLGRKPSLMKRMIGRG